MSLHNLYRSSWNYSIQKNLLREITWRTFFTSYMPSSFQDVKWFERLSTSNSSHLFMRTISSTGLQSFLIFWLALSVDSLFLWEMSMLFFSKTSSFHFTKCRHARNFTSSFWDALCFSWPKIEHWLSHFLMDFSSFGHLLTASKKHFSWRSCKKSSKFVRLIKLNTWSQSFSRESSSVLAVSICRLLIELCVSSRMTISSTSWRHTRKRRSQCSFPLSLTWRRTIGTKSCKNLLSLSRLSSKRSIPSPLMMLSRWTLLRRVNIRWNKTQRIESNSIKDGKSWTSSSRRRTRIILSQWCPSRATR